MFGYNGYAFVLVHYIEIVQFIDTMTAANSAVYVKNAYKHYGPKSGPRHKQVLDGLCMEVQRGSIYGLLGASGCGKTTLLSCIVGRRMLNSGELWVLGGSPGSEGSGVPGPRIGYMPQYFGRIVGMTDEKIDARWGELRELLDLPPDNRRVAECSGGQQRRVSLAAALVHDPELLILDEPTVGLDPVLREKIWNYFVEITTKKNMCVIITTHYIEECRYAHRIGLMRQGKLMAEESPQALISRFRTDTLEEVFLNLSIRQAESTMGDDPELGHVLPVETGSVQSLPGDSINDVSVLGTGGSTDMLTKPTKGEKRRKVSPFSINPKRLGALFYKNWYQYFTNVSGVAFMILFPLIHISVFFLAVGGDPIDLPVAFVNDENGTCAGFKMENSLTFLNETDCEFRQMSCRYIQEVEDPMIRKVFYNNLGTAMDAVRSGKVYGVVYFGNNFSEATIERVQEGRFVSDLALDMSEIKVWLDMSNRQIGPPIQGKLLKKYIEFTKSMLRDCKRNPKMSEIPLNFHDAIYGSVDDSYTVFMVPGLLITVIYFLATMMTSTVIISDRLEGVWDRTLVAGATAAEVLTAHVVIQFVMIVIQSLEAMFVTFVIFRIDAQGTFFNVMGMILSQGVSGMCFGSFYPMLMISGVVWPVEVHHCSSDERHSADVQVGSSRQIQEFYRGHYQVKVESAHSSYVTGQPKIQTQSIQEPMVDMSDMNDDCQETGSLKQNVEVNSVDTFNQTINMPAGTVSNRHDIQIDYCPVPVREFTGRQKELEELKKMFEDHQVIAVVGMGGVGKSQLARKYAELNKNTYQYLLWIQADTTEKLNSSFQELADKLDVKATNKNILLNGIYQAFTKGRALLIFDNVMSQ
ncbi:uncharacterized protein CBL_05040 [Carabus blaptoides fortunei]